MKSDKLGLILYAAGALFIFLMAWVTAWWLIPQYRVTPLEEFEGTIFAVGGLVFNLIFVAIPIGAPLAAIGMLLHTKAKKSRIWPFVAAGVFLLLFGMLFPTMEYYPALFGLLGGAQVVLFIAILWYWAKGQKELRGPEKTASDYQLLAYIFLLMSVSAVCALLGNPFFGLYFPEMVIESGLMPMAHSLGIQLAVLLTLTWLFFFLSHYTLAKKRDRHLSIVKEAKGRKKHEK